MVEYYDNNPNLNEKTVTTFTGEKEYIINCRKFNTMYYVKGKHCHLVNGKWYRVDNGSIVFDHEKNIWVMKNAKLITGIVDFENGTPVIGTFSQNLFHNVQCCYVKIVEEEIPVRYRFQDIPTGMNDEYYCSVTGASLAAIKQERQEAKTKPSTRKVQRREEIKLTCINEQILIDNGYVEDFSTNTWVLPSDLDSSRRIQLTSIKNIIDPRNKGYNIEDNVDEFATKCNLYQEYNTPITKKARIFARYLSDTTFGYEIETIMGYLPEHIQNRYGVIVCRDGSLKAPDGSQGSEYTSIPQSGAKGVVSLHHVCKEITRRNIIDEHCAYHLHLGNLPTTRTFIVTLYKLILDIQDEVFSLFAYYKNDEPKYAGKEKNYCNKLMKLSIGNCSPSNKEEFNNYINWSYKKIFAFLSERSIPDASYNRKNKRHPKSYKWERHNRYFWLNLMNVIFSTRNTVEFRLHTGTTNSQKAINWLFICNAIVKTAIAKSRDILEGKHLTLEDVLSYYPDTYKTEHSKFLFNYLMGYINERKSLMKRDLEKRDYVSHWEIETDRNYEYIFEGIKDLV